MYLMHTSLTSPPQVPPAIPWLTALDHSKDHPALPLWGCLTGVTFWICWRRRVSDVCSIAKLRTTPASVPWSWTKNHIVEHGGYMSETVDRCDSGRSTTSIGLAADLKDWCKHMWLVGLYHAQVVRPTWTSLKNTINIIRKMYMRPDPCAKIHAPRCTGKRKSLGKQLDCNPIRSGIDQSSQQGVSYMAKLTASRGE